MLAIICQLVLLLYARFWTRFSVSSPLTSCPITSWALSSSTAFYPAGSCFLSSHSTRMPWKGEGQISCNLFLSFHQWWSNQNHSSNFPGWVAYSRADSKRVVEHTFPSLILHLTENRILMCIKVCSNLASNEIGQSTEADQNLQDPRSILKGFSLPTPQFPASSQNPRGGEFHFIPRSYADIWEEKKKGNNLCNFHKSFGIWWCSGAGGGHSENMVKFIRKEAFLARKTKSPNFRVSTTTEPHIILDGNASRIQTSI